MTRSAPRTARTRRPRASRTTSGAARPGGCPKADVDCAAQLLASAISYRHSVARHVAEGQEAMHRELRFLADALAAGADTAQIRAALSLLAVRSSRWPEATFQARAALTAARGTIRHPFPGDFFTQAMAQVALQAPPELADSMLTYAVTRRPGSARYREFAAAAALRAGKCDEAAAALVALVDFAIIRDDGPALMRDCWTRQRSMVESTGTQGAGSGAVRRAQKKATH